MGTIRTKISKINLLLKLHPEDEPLRLYDDLWLKKGCRPAGSFLSLIDP
jgi:hypothetical protein